MGVRLCVSAVEAEQGLVVILPRKGILVSDINPRQRCCFGMRQEIERLLSRTSAERATDSEKAAFLKSRKALNE
jgi:DNA-binding GntR family transcriptional regulator